MVETIPSLTYGTVTGRFLAAVADSLADNDKYPDGVPLTGTVKFTPSVSALLLTTTNPPMTVLPAAIVATLDEQGYVSLNGSRGVSLIATDTVDTSPTMFTYEVSFQNIRYAGGPNLPYPPFSIAVPANTTTDLALTAPLPASTGTPVVRDENAVWQAAEDTKTNAAMVLELSGQVADDRIVVQQAVTRVIVDASMSGTSLVLKRVDGTTVNLGNIKGDNGDVATTMSANAGATLTVGTDVGTRRVTLIGGPVVATAPTPTANRSFTWTAVIMQDTVGGRTITWPTNVKWPYGVKPTLSTAPNAIDVVHFFWTGQEWLGFVGGQAFA